MKSSGSIIALVIVTLGLLIGGTTWWRYSAENPTSSNATLSQRDGQWIVSASFPGGEYPNLRVGTGAIITSPEFPKTRMTGMIQRINPDDSVVIVLDRDPPDTTGLTSARARVTIDAATAPQ